MDLTIKVNKTKLLTSLAQNKAKHVADYKQAMQGWKKEVMEIVIREANNLSNTSDFSSFIRRNNPIFDISAAPVSRESDYNQAIEMLEYCSDIEIELQTHQYNAYVKDEWNWKSHWNLSNSKYLSA